MSEDAIENLIETEDASPENTTALSATAASTTDSAAPVGTKIQEPSSGTDDDEPSAKPAIIPDDLKNESKEMTVEEIRACFVNQGLMRWETARSAWLGERGDSDDTGSSARPTAVPLDVDKIIDVLFYASSREGRAGNAKPEKFPLNVPLPQMVDILQGRQAHIYGKPKDWTHS
eukprot:scaffold3195_cov162-Amphora_coffeaeformis.AAC.12